MNAGTPRYIAPIGIRDDADRTDYRGMRLPAACTASNLKVTTLAYTAGTSATITLLKGTDPTNLAATALTCTTTGTPRACTDAAHTVSIGTDDYIAWRANHSGGFGTSMYNANFYITFSCN
jgi:hypothetical protein